MLRPRLTPAKYSALDSRGWNRQAVGSARSHGRSASCGRRAEIDPPLVPQDPHPVRLGGVDPDRPGGIHVCRPHHADLSGPHPGEPLQLDHRPDLAGDVRPDRVNEGVGDRPELFRVPHAGLAAAERRHHLQGLVGGQGNQLLPDRPLERPDDALGPRVHLVATQVLVDEHIADSLEPQGPELAGRGVAIEFADRLERQPDVPRLRGGPAVPNVLGVNIIRVRRGHFRDGGIGRGGGPGRLGGPDGSPRRRGTDRFEVNRSDTMNSPIRRLPGTWWCDKVPATVRRRRTVRVAAAPAVFIPWQCRGARVAALQALQRDRRRPHEETTAESCRLRDFKDLHFARGRRKQSDRWGRRGRTVRSGRGCLMRRGREGVGDHRRRRG